MNLSDKYRPSVPSGSQHPPLVWGGAQEGTKPMEYRICVTGAPKYVRSHEIAEFFSAIGPIKVRRFHPPIGNSFSWREGQVRQGPSVLRHFILITESESIYSTILKLKSIMFKGRSLGVIPIRTGWELKKYYEKINRRKIILKKVPGQITLDELREFIESRYGSVENMYEFLTDRRDTDTPSVQPSERTYLNASNSSGQKRFKSYSVVFESLDSLALLPKDSQVNIRDDISIIIELHHKVSKATAGTLEADAKSVQLTNTTTTAANRNLFRIGDNAGSISSWTGRSLRPGKSTLPSTFAPSSKQFSNPTTQASFDPSIKPTRRVYFTVRNTPYENKHYSPSGHRYRFNLAKSF